MMRKTIICVNFYIILLSAISNINHDEKPASHIFVFEKNIWKNTLNIYPPIFKIWIQDIYCWLYKLKIYIYDTWHASVPGEKGICADHVELSGCTTRNCLTKCYEKWQWKVRIALCELANSCLCCYECR